MKIIQILKKISHIPNIYKEKLQECPCIKPKIRDVISAITDTGCELTLMNEEVYNKIK
jgi:hypothetical protein